jgi:hypothetical protein
MAAGTLYFLLVRSDLSAKVRSVAIYAAVITFVASIMYYIMATNVWNGQGIGLEAESDAIGGEGAFVLMDQAALAATEDLEKVVFVESVAGDPHGQASYKLGF